MEDPATHPDRRAADGVATLDGVMRLAVLGSGSQGNAVVVEAAGRRLLVDAGFTAKEITRRLAILGLAPGDLDAIVLTHEHGDHVLGAKTLARRFALPVYATAGTLSALPWAHRGGIDARAVRSGEPFEVAGLEVEPFGVPHDAREPVGLVMEDHAGSRLGLVADLGCRSQLAWGRMRDLDTLILEANHDLELLRRGPYPWHLKERVASRHGHLSNRDAADGAVELAGPRLRRVVLYHLSRTNNLAPLALEVVAEALTRAGAAVELTVSEQYHGTPWMEVGRPRRVGQLPLFGG